MIGLNCRSSLNRAVTELSPGAGVAAPHFPVYRASSWIVYSFGTVQIFHATYPVSEGDFSSKRWDSAEGIGTAELWVHPSPTLELVCALEELPSSGSLVSTPCFSWLLSYTLPLEASACLTETRRRSRTVLEVERYGSWHFLFLELIWIGIWTLPSKHHFSKSPRWVCLTLENIVPENELTFFVEPQVPWEDGHQTT